MIHFLPPPFSRLLACAIFPVLLPAPASANEITYQLPKDGKVSLAVYDSEGQMIRTLRNAEPQKAGTQTVNWDGLDLNGKPVAAGKYTWKLLLNQGMKAEYLLNLGISSGIRPWIGQHGGPQGISVSGDSFTIGGSPEGSPLLVKVKLDGSYDYSVENFEPAGFRSIATDGGLTYVLMDSGKIFSIHSATGKKVGKAEDGPMGKLLTLTTQSLEPISPTTETKPLTIPVTGGRYLLQVKAGQTDVPNGAFRLQGDLGEFYYPPTEAGKFTQSLTPTQYSTLLPKAPKGSELKITFANPANAAAPWAVAEINLLAAAESIDARFGELIASYPGAGTLAWLDPKTAEVVDKIELPERKIGAAILMGPGKALAFSGSRLALVSRDGSVESKVEGLVSPVALALDPSNGGYWVAEGGTSQQVKFFDKSFKLQKTFGRLGGRLAGNYVPEDFLEISGIAADGQGGFLITEANSAPRRTARFDAKGNLLKEWYGGQQFYTFAAPDPEDADILWMDSQWGWLMKVKVDWDKRDWKVLGTYRWGGDASPELFNRFKMAHPHHVKKLDLDKDGKKETYLADGAGLQWVDEATGQLQPVSLQSMIAANRAWNWNLPADKMPQPWIEAIRLLGDDPEQNRQHYRAFAWADANGDTQFQAEEFRLAKNAQVEARRGVLITDDLSFIRSNDWNGKGDRAPNFSRYRPQGFTASGSPIWDWGKSEAVPAWVPGESPDLLISKSGDIYQIVHGAFGDGYKGLGIYSMSHSFGWPGNQTHSTSIWKWNEKGKFQWVVGPQATRQNNDPGQLHYPVHFAGLVNGTLGVCDKVVQPVVFWTEDGLYAGGLFDRRTEDGLPPRVYSWWHGGTDDAHPETGRALIQCDMALGGSLIQRPNGDVIFIGSGWNSCPAYRVTGWENFERQTGTISVRSAATAIAAGTGSGLQGEFFAGDKLAGTPVEAGVTPQIWFEPARATAEKKPAFNWPGPSANEVISARWTGTVEPKFSEDYTFHLYRQNGTARLWLGGRLILETNTELNKLSSAPISLKAGKKYDLRLEWTGKRAGELHLSWQSLSLPIEHIPTRALYPESSASTAEVISLKPSVERAVRPIKGAKPIPPPEWTLTRNGSFKDPLRVELQWSGSARSGVDYLDLPTQLTFKPGQKELRVPVRLLPVGAEIASTTDLRGNVGISANYRFDGGSNGGAILISDPRIQRISGVKPTVVELERPENPPVRPSLNTDHLIRLVDGSGLDESASPPTHDTDVNHAWLGEWLNLGKVQLNFDLGGLYQLTELRIWNFNSRDSHEGGWGTGDSVRWGAERIRISTAASPDGPWTGLGVTFLRRPLGRFGDPGQLIRVNQIASHLRITFPNGGVRPLGLAEIAFYGTPAQSPR